LQAVEVAVGVVREGDVPGGEPQAVLAAVTPTQIRRPNKAMIRTVFQAFLGLCALSPFLVAAGMDPAQVPWLAVPLAVAAGVTRVMSIPQVELWLRTYLPWLAAAPTPDEDEEG